MRAAFVDTSAVVAMVLRESTETEIAIELNAFDIVMASNLLEAELRSVCHRERRELSETLIADIEWIHPRRALTPEIARVLAAGYVRGADCWHLANALFIAPDPAGFAFITRDVRQRAVARALGFQA